MTRTATLLLLLLAALAPGTAFAGETRKVAWEGATIEYDADVWKVFAPLDARDMVFTCIAADCPGSPNVYAYAWKKQGEPDASTQFACDLRDVEQAGNFGPLAAEVPADEPGIAFSAATVWSGCRAIDTPILKACAEHEGIAYRLTTGIASGCNRAPPMPEARFLELLRGVKPKGPR